MKPFVHDDESFHDLLRIVADSRGLDPGLVEKDYWVTHALWYLESAGFSLWFKGGTSLSKGFGIIHRFSEDLDLKIDPESVPGCASLNWKSQNKGPIRARKQFFETLAASLVLPGVTAVELEEQKEGAKWTSGNIRIVYPRSQELDPVMRPFVLLEIGDARVTPCVPRPMTSFVHDHLQDIGQPEAFHDNRPRQIRCVHPYVTLLEKLAVLTKRVTGNADPSSFVRHFEDAAKIIQSAAELPTIPDHRDPKHLAEVMMAEGDLGALPRSRAAAFSLVEDTAREREIRAAYAAIGSMYWGPRVALEDCRSIIRGWLDTTIAADHDD